MFCNRFIRIIFIDLKGKKNKIMFNVLIFLLFFILDYYLFFFFLLFKDYVLKIK